MNLSDLTIESLHRFRDRHPRAAKVAHNTTLTGAGSVGDPFVIRLHATDVVTVTDDTVRFNSGGWQTVTTRERMNRAMPFGCRLFQRQWEWFVTTPHTTIPVGGRFTLRKLSDGSWNVVDA